MNVYLHCIVSNIKRIGLSKIQRYPPGRNFCGRPWMHGFLFLSNSWVINRGAVWFDSCDHLKTINVIVVSFLSLYRLLNAVIKKLYNSEAWWTTSKHKKSKGCFDIHARGPQKREAPGICPVCPIFNPALVARSTFCQGDKKGPTIFFKFISSYKGIGTNAYQFISWQYSAITIVAQQQNKHVMKDRKTTT